MLLALLVLAGLGLCRGDDGQGHGGHGMTEALIGAPGGPKLTLWTPGHLDQLHDALLEGRPLRAQFTPTSSSSSSASSPSSAAAAKLSLWVPRGQEQEAALALQDEYQDRSALVVREAAQDDAELHEDADEDDGVAMSPSWLRGAVGPRSIADGPDSNGLLVGRLRRARRASRSAAAAESARSLGHFRRKRTASPGPSPNEASSEDASVAADSSKKAPMTPAPSAAQAAQAKAARSHQFITGRNEKEPPPVVREVEAGDKTAAGAAPGPPPPTHASPVAAGSSSSRVGAGRDALGLRVNEIPQGPRYSSVYEAETMRHAADHRHYTADNYGNHNAYAASYGGGYGSGYGGGGYGSGSSVAPYSAAPALPQGPQPPTHGRSAGTPTATPRRIIYYASLPDPAPAPQLQQLQQQQPYPLSPVAPLPPLPGSARVPHEYRGPPYDVNGAYSSDGRYPPPPGPGLGGPANDNLYRYTIIDAEPPGPPLGAYRSNGLPTGLPYRDRLPGASPAPAAYPQPYRINPPPPPSPTTDAGPQAASPIQYTQYDYNGIGARTATSSALVDAKQGLGPGAGLPPGLPLSDDPYRGFNPRQPAPWSMQVGTRLTVKDDGYGNASPGGLPPAARRFYVTSQQQPGYGDPRDPRDPRDPLSAAYAPAPARFPRPLDRDRTGLVSSSSGRSEPRNRLYR